MDWIGVSVSVVIAPTVTSYAVKTPKRMMTRISKAAKATEKEMGWSETSSVGFDSPSGETLDLVEPICTCVV